MAEEEAEAIKIETTSKTIVQAEAVVAAAGTTRTGISRVMAAEVEGWAEAIGAMISEAVAEGEAAAVAVAVAESVV